MGSLEYVVQEMFYLVENYFRYSMEGNGNEGVCVSKLFNTLGLYLSKLESRCLVVPLMLSRVSVHF